MLTTRNGSRWVGMCFPSIMPFQVISNVHRKKSFRRTYFPINTHFRYSFNLVIHVMTRANSANTLE